MPETPRCDTNHTYLQSTNNNCLQLTVGGDGSYNNPYQIAGNIQLGKGIVCTPDGLSVCVSHQSDNQLSYSTDGCLYVAPPLFVQPDECDPVSGCITVTVLGSGCPGDAYKILAEPVINPSCELLTCGPDGLCVSPPSLLGLSNNSIDLSITGNGNPSSPWSIEATLSIDPTPINSLKSTSQGLFAHTFVNGGETLTSMVVVNGDGTQPNPYVITNDVKIDPTPGNALVVNGNGLRVDAQQRSKYVEVTNLIASAGYLVNHNLNLLIGEEADVVVQVRDSNGLEHIVRAFNHTSNSLIVESLINISSARIIVLS